MPKGHPLACLDLDVICRHFWCAALRIAACVRLSTSEQLSAPSLQGQPQQGLARRQEQRGCGLQRSSALGSQVRRAGRGGGALGCCAPQWGARSRSVVCQQAATSNPQSPQQGFNRLPHPTKRARLSPPPPPPPPTTPHTHHPTHTPPPTHPLTHPRTHNNNTTHICRRLQQAMHGGGRGLLAFKCPPTKNGIVSFTEPNKQSRRAVTTTQGSNRCCWFYAYNDSDGVWPVDTCVPAVEVEE